MQLLRKNNFLMFFKLDFKNWKMSKNKSRDLIWTTFSSQKYVFCENKTKLRTIDLGQTQCDKYFIALGSSNSVCFDWCSRFFTLTCFYLVQKFFNSFFLRGERGVCEIQSNCQLFINITIFLLLFPTEIFFDFKLFKNFDRHIIGS